MVGGIWRLRRKCRNIAKNIEKKKSRAEARKSPVAPAESEDYEPDLNLNK
jgi:hypothetical protein